MRETMGAGVMQKLPVCELAYMSDGRVLVGYSNRDENGGFTPVGDLTQWYQKHKAEVLAEVESVKAVTGELAFSNIRAALHAALAKAEGN